VTEKACDLTKAGPAGPGERLAEATEYDLKATGQWNEQVR